ncbi:MAG: DUF192 domain-containing protein [Candidatus Aenigmarchaeota archaeon]|nr:DUF192 domain-containing protein [Candidatus Aenigmarchaeota archaeon]
MKRKSIVAAAFPLIMILFLSYYEKPTDEKIIYFSSGVSNTTLLVKIADTEESRNKGLMFVEKLGRNEGMLFVFSDERQRAFWMKDTLVHLDMIFVASNGTVVGVVENAEPCRQELCRTYSVNALSQYVVEVNAGFARKNNISPGSVAVSNL